MKEKGLIPKDSFTVKVLARGVIDKPLTVLANSFSICAVKMIALTGGEAKRVRSTKTDK
jgi:ribosomal protein L15